MLLKLCYNIKGKAYKYFPNWKIFFFIYSTYAKLNVKLELKF